MKSITRTMTGLALVALLGCAPAQAQDAEAMTRLLTTVQQKASLVGVAGGVIEDSEIAVVGAAGLKKSGGTAPLTPTDTFHIGSLTKSFTAALIGTLVDEGLLSWDTRVGEVFEDAHTSWRDVTVFELLTHSAGAPPNFPISTFVAPDPDTHDALVERRHELVANLVSKPLPESRGSFSYSNAGYTIAAAMAEKLTDSVWEDLLTERVLGPLGINAGVGAPVGPEAPGGHRNIFGFDLAVDPTKSRADNPAFMRPAGGLHMTLEDLLRWADFHLGDGSELLSSESFAKLQDAAVAINARQSYAGGWIVDPSGGGIGAGPLVWHNGSNTMWYALLMLFPDNDGAIVMASNDGDMPSAEPALVRAAAMIAQRRGWATDAE